MILKKLKKPYRWSMNTKKSNCWGISLFYYLMLRTQQSNQKKSLPYNLQISISVVMVAVNPGYKITSATLAVQRS